MAITANDAGLLGSFTQEQERTLKERRANLWTEVGNLLTRGNWTAEDAASHARMDAEIDSLTAQIDAGLKLRAANTADAEVVGERAERTGTSVDQHSDVFRRYLVHGINDLTPEDRSVMMRVQNTLVGTQGGFLVPDGFWNRLVEVQKQYGPIESAVNSITTSTGNDLPWLTNDDTANEGEIVGETESVTQQDLTFGVKVLRAHTYSSKQILVSWQLLQDSAIDIEGLIARKAGIRLARIHSRHFTVGTGTNQPEGIAVGLTGGKTFASATAITYDELIDIQHILDPAYRGGTQRWMFSDATLKIVRKLVDGQGNKAWQPSLQLGIPDRILGDPYIVNQNMPAPTTGNVSVLYGDFNSGYIIRKVKGATAVRISEKYAESLQTGYFVWDRMDGKKDDTNAYTYGIQA